jgi:hypothetical protein
MLCDDTRANGVCREALSPFDHFFASRFAESVKHGYNDALASREAGNAALT